MTDMPTPRRSRSRRAERTEHLYTARADEYAQPQVFQRSEEQTTSAAYRPNEEETPFAAYQPNEEEEALFAAYRPNETARTHAPYRPNEERDPFARYTPNEETNPFAGFAPNEEPDAFEAFAPNEEPEPLPPAPEEIPQVDYAAYYTREGAEEAAQPAFAPPPSMQRYSFAPQEWGTEWAEEETENVPAANAYANTYRPREVTWADAEEEKQSAQAYQVEDEHLPLRPKRHGLRNALIILLVLALLGGAAWLLRDRIAEWTGISVFENAPTESPAAALVTPEPVKAYDAAPAAAVAPATRSAIARLSGTVEMVNHAVTARHVVTRSQRGDGSWDFYLFTAEGRLLCYFEGLALTDMFPLDNDTFYVRQAPWLIAASGSALIRTADIEAAIGESVFLHPMYRGWAVVESEADGSANYVNAEGQLLSSLWFSRTFPFTGEYTLAYVDTGSTADEDDRYLLYVIGQDGSMVRWLSTGHMEDAVAAVCGLAYMSDGTLYRLPDTDAPICQSAQVTAYPDCDAVVVRDPASGKYGLFVHGEQHYGFEYDAIHPLESDIAWSQKTLVSGSAQLTVRAVGASAWPLPLSHSFVLEKNGQSEYVALSAQSASPILLDGEF